MVFSSITFLFYFLPLFLLAYYFLPGSNLIILLASLLFYGWGDPTALPLLLFCIVLNWWFGLRIAHGGEREHLLLVLGVATNLALLLFFKYTNFLVAQWQSLASHLSLPAPAIPDIALPLGISFFTFQGISYLVDISRGVVPAQPSLLKFAMYKAMFPPLIAGPIVRYATIADQVDSHNVTRDRLASGIQQFIIGLAQKMLIANTVAVPADRIFALPADELTTAAAWLGAICYALQIYFDFGGYSNMAIGLGRMMGFELPRNFDRPYASQSVTEFWRRWHMTLSSWFRDYVYIPLGGNRYGTVRTGAHLLIVFFLCGFWHGASWNFAIWGLYHGVFLILERIGLGRVLAAMPALVRHAYLLVVVVVGWVPFRAETLDGTITYLRAMLHIGTVSGPAIPSQLNEVVVLAMLVGAIAAVWPPARPPIGHTWSFVARHAACLALFILSAASLVAGTHNPFIYFRF